MARSRCVRLVHRDALLRNHSHRPGQERTTVVLCLFVNVKAVHECNECTAGPPPSHFTRPPAAHIAIASPPPPPPPLPSIFQGAARFARTKNTLQMGLCGLPNVGKSSLFNLLCKQSVAVSFAMPHTHAQRDARTPTPSTFREPQQKLLACRHRNTNRR
jgi:hypothetical protein